MVFFRILSFFSRIVCHRVLCFFFFLLYVCLLPACSVRFNVDHSLTSPERNDPKYYLYKLPFAPPPLCRTSLVETFHLTPCAQLHFRTDAPIELKSLFFFPSYHTEKFGMARMEPGISLYSRKASEAVAFARLASCYGLCLPSADHNLCFRRVCYGVGLNPDGGSVCGRLTLKLQVDRVDFYHSVRKCKHGLVFMLFRRPSYQQIDTRHICGGVLG